MAQSGYTPIKIYASVTASAVPLAANLDNTNGAELAINTNDGKLYYKDSSGVVQTIASKASAANSFSAGTTGLTPSTATTGAVTLAGTLGVANGGTNGSATPTAGAVPYGTGTAYAFTSAGTAGQVLQSNGASAPTWVAAATGTVTAVSVTSANGFAGTSSGGATPALTLTTSISGVLKGSSSALAAATAGTDFVAPATATNFTAQQYFGNVALTDAATISWAASTAQVATFTFVSSNRTMGAPTGLVNGAFYALAVIQNGGSNTLTWNSVFKWAAGTAPTLSTAAGAKDYFTFRSDGTNLYQQGISQAVA